MPLIKQVFPVLLGPYTAVLFTILFPFSKCTFDINLLVRISAFVENTTGLLNANTLFNLTSINILTPPHKYCTIFLIFMLIICTKNNQSN